jgi:hypothetical protein
MVRALERACLSSVMARYEDIKYGEVGLISVACIGVLQPCGLRSVADTNKIRTDLESTLILGPERRSSSICALMSGCKHCSRQILDYIYPSWMSTSIFR